MRGATNIWKKIMNYGLENVLGLWYSSYRGFVINNEDPLNLGRLQIQVPAVDGSWPDPTWVPSKGQWGGDDYGFNCVPKVGDMVWVEYEYGRASAPMWSHHGYGQRTDETSEKPEEFSSNNVYGFKTPYGQIITIDDGTLEDGEYKGAEITIKTKDGKKIVINELAGIQIDATESGNVEIKGGAGIIELSEQGISIDTKDKPLWLNGSNRVLYAKSEYATEILTVADISISDSTRVGL